MDITRDGSSVLANRIQEQRMVREMTQAEVARKIGITKSSLSLYETGKNIPPADVVRKLAELYYVSADYLLGISNVPCSINGGADIYANNLLKEMVKIYRTTKHMSDAIGHLLQDAKVIVED